MIPSGDGDQTAPSPMAVWQAMVGLGRMAQGAAMSGLGVAGQGHTWPHRRTQGLGWVLLRGTVVGYCGVELGVGVDCNRPQVSSKAVHHQAARLRRLLGYRAVRCLYKASGPQATWATGPQVAGQHPTETIQCSTKNNIQ